MPKIDGREIHFDPSVREATEEHCFSRVDVEVGGFLLGNIDDSEVRVVASQPAETAQSGQTQLTFTHEAWDEVLGKMNTDFAGMEIVGWYHSHPGFGCFLSDYDIFIQENFFASPGQHALVIDPIAGKEAVFTAKGGESKTISTGDTKLAALGEGQDVQSGNEVRAALVEQQIAQAIGSKKHRTGSLVAKSLGVVTLLLISVGLGWFVGNLQGRDAERVSANSQVTDLQQQLTDAASTLAIAEDELAAIESTQPEPEPVASPEPETIVNPVPTPGSRATVDIEYQIRSGDNLWTIAERFIGDGNQYNQLLKWNPDVRTNGLIPGDTIVLRLPATVVSEGE